jgi:cAMP-dependent protein kinase regulator
MIEYLETQKKNRDQSQAVDDDDAPADAEADAEAAAEEEDDAPAEPMKKPPPKRGRRTGVSAESSDQMSSAPTERIVHAKSEAAKEGIRATVANNILFNSLDRAQLDIVVDAMFEFKAAVGTSVITQGQEGDNFFIVESGSLECFVQVSKDKSQPPLMVKTYARGDAFGELALMYNCPRAATIKAKTASVLWALDRVTFRSVLMDTTSGKRRRYEAFLEKVDMLAGLDKYERSKVADALVESTHAAGEVIIKQVCIPPAVRFGADSLRVSRVCLPGCLPCLYFCFFACPDSLPACLLAG